MQTVWSDQYNVRAVVVGDETNFDAVAEECRRVGAVFYEDGPDDECFVVVLREVGPELYTPRALEGSLRSRAARVL